MKNYIIASILFTLVFYSISPVFAEINVVIENGSCTAGEECSFTITLDENQISSFRALILDPLESISISISDSSGNVIKEANMVFNEEIGLSIQSAGEYTVTFVDVPEDFTYKIGVAIIDWNPVGDTPPIIVQPKDIVVNAIDPNGITPVTFEVLVTDDSGDTIIPTCKPTSGFLFGIRDTIVKCTAKDSRGNFAIPVQFTVTVNPPEETQIDPPSLELDQIMAEFQTSDGAANNAMTIDLTLTDLDGNGIEHITYNIKATQGSDVLLNEEGHMHKGILSNTHTTDVLPFDASDSIPVVITIESIGFGHDEQYVAVTGEIANKQVVPEFGAITALILAVAIISIIVVSAKSRLSIIPRY